MDFHLFVLRFLYSAPAESSQARIFLLFALVLAVQLYLAVRARPGDSRRRRLLISGAGLAVALAAAVGFGAWGFQTQGMRQHNLELAASAPVRFGYGAGGPLIQVFTAPECGPCAVLKERLATVIASGYRVEYIPSPLIEEGWEAVIAAACQDDPKAGFEKLFRGGPAAVPAVAPGCRTRVRENEEVLRRLAGRAVYPTIVMPDGLVMTGAPSLPKLKAYLQAAAPAGAAPL